MLDLTIKTVKFFIFMLKLLSKFRVEQNTISKKKKKNLWKFRKIDLKNKRETSFIYHWAQGKGLEMGLDFKVLAKLMSPV